MARKFSFFILVLCLLITLNSCSLFKKPIDKKTGFSAKLKQTEYFIRSEDWGNAKSSLEDSIKIWKRVKPLLQIDIDHDYVDSIEEDFVKLEGFIETKAKALSLSTILFVEDVWENIGSF